MELDNVRMLHALKHLQFVIDHLLISSNVALEDDFDSDLALRALSFPHDTICTSAECFPESIARSTALSAMHQWGGNRRTHFLS